MSTYRTHFAYRIDRWDANGDGISDHVAGIDDLVVARSVSIRGRLQTLAR